MHWREPSRNQHEGFRSGRVRNLLKELAGILSAGEHLERGLLPGGDLHPHPDLHQVLPAGLVALQGGPVLADRVSGRPTLSPGLYRVHQRAAVVALDDRSLEGRRGSPVAVRQDTMSSYSASSSSSSCQEPLVRSARTHASCDTSIRGRGSTPRPRIPPGTPCPSITYSRPAS